MDTPTIIDPGFFDVSNPPFGPILYAGLYHVPLISDADGSIVMLTSTDLATWNTLAAATGPAVSFQGFFDNANSITLFYTNDGVTFEFIDFDLAGGTWGVPYGSIKFGNTTDPFVQRRSDGSVTCVYVLSNSNAFYNVFDGMTWGTQKALDTNGPGILASTVVGVSSVVDASNITHTFSAWTDQVSTVFILYQQILANNTLGAFNLYSDASLTNPSPLVGTPTVSNTHDWVAVPVYVGVAGNIGVLFGSGLSAPTFSLSPAISPVAFAGAPAPNLVNQADTTLFIASSDSTGTLLYVFSSFSVGNPKAGWSPLIDGVDSTIGSLAAIGIKPGNIVVFAGIDSNGLSNWLLEAGAPPPPPPPAPTVITGPFYQGIPLAGVYSLPDPAVLCDIDGRKKCVMIKDVRPNIQRRK